MHLQAERESHLRELCVVLESLHQALGPEVTAAERAAVSKLFVGPSRLFGSNLEAVGTVLGMPVL